MGELTGGTTVALGDVVRLSKERSSDPDADGFERYVGLEHLEPGDLRLRRWGEVSDGTTFTNVFRPGQVLFGKRRAYQRKIALADFSGVCSGDIYVLESRDPSQLLPELLPFICQTEAFCAHAVSTSAGSLSPRTNWTSMGRFEFLLPSIAKQRELVRLASATTSVLETLFDTESKHASLRDAHIASILGGWSKSDRIPLSELATRVGVGIASSVTHAYTASGVPMIQNSNIRRGTIDFRDGQYVTKEFDVSNASKRLRSGDVVVARTGVPGAAAVIPDRFVGGHTFTTLIISPDPSRLIPKFLALWINAAAGRAFFASRKGGGVQQNMNATVLRDLPVPVLSLSYQSVLVAVDESHEEAALAIQQRCVAASALKDSVLARLASELGDPRV